MSVVDTNILVQATISTAPEHLCARAALARLRAPGWVAVPRKVLREYMAATTRPQTWSRALMLAEAVAEEEAGKSRGLGDRRGRALNPSKRPAYGTKLDRSCSNMS